MEDSDASVRTKAEQPHRKLGSGLDAAYGRRLSDKVQLAFYQAYEQRDVEVARRLLDVIDFMWLRDIDQPWGRRGNVNYGVFAREQFLHLLYLVGSPNSNAGAQLDERGLPLPGRTEPALAGGGGQSDTAPPVSVGPTASKPGGGGGK